MISSLSDSLESDQKRSLNRSPKRGRATAKTTPTRKNANSLPKSTILHLLVLFLPLQLAYSRAVPYTNQDDVSWAITRPNHLAYPYHQQLYNEFMDKCNQASSGSCQDGENFRLMMNRVQPSGVYNYTQVRFVFCWSRLEFVLSKYFTVANTTKHKIILQTGFQKIKCPQALLDLLLDFWNKNKGKEEIEWKSVNSYHNMWDSPPWFISLENARLGGGDDLQRQVWRLARPVLEEWTGQRLSPVSMYGIRIYSEPPS